MLSSAMTRVDGAIAWGRMLLGALLLETLLLVVTIPIGEIFGVRSPSASAAARAIRTSSSRPFRWPASAWVMSLGGG